MAWNASVGTQAPHYQQQQQPHQYNQQGYGQPPQGQQFGQQHQYGQQHQPYQQQPYGQGQYQQHRHPNQSYPTKRKGNPVITRYAPPPGYQGPQQQGGGYAQNQYQQQSPQSYSPPQGFQQQPNYPPNPGFPPPPGNYPPQQGFNPPHNYQQAQGYGQTPQYQGGYQPPPQPNYVNQNYQHPQGYQGPQGFGPPQGGYHGQHGYQQQGYQGGQGPSSPPQHHHNQQQWQNQGQQGTYPPNNHQSSHGPQDHDSNANQAKSQTEKSSPTQIQQPTSATSKSSTPKVELFLAWDDWDFDFDGALWPKGNELIDPNLSIGVIVWHPGTQVTRALPSNYAKAESQALSPPAEKLNNGASISEFFTVENSYEAFLDIRQTDHWDIIKDDIIFYEFPETETETYPTQKPEEVLKYRRDWSPPPEDEITAEEIAQSEPSSNQWGNLEQPESSSWREGPSNGQGWSSSTTPSRNIQHRNSRDQGQEDLLARLGVTGSPKPVKPIKDQEYLPEPITVPSTPQLSSPGFTQRASRSNSFARNLQQPIYGPTTGLRPPPPPEPERSPSYDPWKADQPPRVNGHSAANGGRPSPARSDGSQHTLAGEDFNAETKSESHKKSTETAMEDTHRSSRPSLSHSESNNSRKRSYEESEPSSDEKQRQQDDVTPRHKRRQPQVAAAYSRRW